MKKQFLLPIILLLFTFNSNVFSQNLVLNASFEDYTSDTNSGAISSLNSWSISRKTKLKVDLTTPYDGNSAIYFQNRAKGSVKQIITLNPNQTYDISIQVKWSEGALGKGVLNVKDDTGNLIESMDLDGMETDWTEYKFQFSTSSNSNIEISVNRWKNNGINPLGELYFDDVSLTDPSMIYNDTWWNDNNGDNIVASFGGHLTKVGDTYYWVGNNPNESVHGPDVHMYSSKTLGSNTWKHEGKLLDFNPGETGDKNCTLLQSPATGKFILLTKGIKFYESSNVTGPYTLANSISKWQIDDRAGQYKIGGMGTYQDGANAYIISSRRYLGAATPEQPLNHRYTGIYKLTPDFLDIEEEICWLRNDSREAMWLFKKDNTFYMTGSHTAGWTASNCYYRTSTNLVDWSAEAEIGMDPERPGGTQALKIMRSHGTQHRWIIKVGDQWMYGGDRYPYQEPESHPFEKGLYLFTPVVWEGEKPIVRYEESWSVAGYGASQSQSNKAIVKNKPISETIEANNKLVSQNYPNPFSDKTTIKYAVPVNIKSTDLVTLNIFNIRGQLVNQLINQHKAPGQYTIEWNGSNANGYKVSSGLYIAEITVGTQKNNIKLMYSKK